MRNELKPVEGPWFTDYRKTKSGGYAQEVFDQAGDVIATMSWYPVQIDDVTTSTNREANARLIAEAGTVLHETGLTPRQLAEQRAELLRLLDLMYDRFENGDPCYDDDMFLGNAFLLSEEDENAIIAALNAANATQQRNATGGEG